MSIESKLSGHWTDEELIGSLYGVSLDGTHLEDCQQCQARLMGMQARRQQIESTSEENEQVSFEFLAAQRRAIYQRLEKPAHWWTAGHLRRLTAGVATALVISGSAYLYEQNRAMEVAKERVSDAKLLQEVSAMAAMDSGAHIAEPLQGLFE